MQIDSLILTVVAASFIFSALKQLRLSSSISVYNLSVVGLTCSFALVILYQYYPSRLLIFLSNIPFLGDIFIHNPGVLLNAIVALATVSAIVFTTLYCRFIWLSQQFESFVKRHQYRMALQFAEKRLDFLYSFYGDHYWTGAAIGGLAGFYTIMGEREKAKSLFKEAISTFQKSFFIRSENQSALDVRVKLRLRLSELYLSEGSYSEAETNCRKLIKSANKKKIEDILLVQAMQIIALSRGFQGDLREFAVLSTKARNAYRVWVRKKRGFRKIRMKLKLATELLIKQVPTLILAICLMPPILFPSLRTYWYLAFIGVLYILTQILELVLAILIRQNVEKEESTVQYCSLIEQEGKFYEALGDYGLALEKYDEALDTLSSLYEGSVSKELVVAKNFQNRAILQTSVGFLKASSIDDQNAYYQNAVLDYDRAIERYALLQKYSSNFIPFNYANNYALCLVERALTYVKLVGLEMAEGKAIKAFSDAKELLTYPSSDYISNILNFGFMYYWDGQYSKAKGQYVQAKELIEKERSGKVAYKIDLCYLEVLLNIADGNMNRALADMQDIIEESSFSLQQCLSITSEKHKISAIENGRFHLNTYATLVYKYFLKSPAVVGNLFDLVIQRKAISTEMWMAQRDFIIEDSASPLKEDIALKWRSLKELRRKIAHLSLEDNFFQSTQIKELARDKEVLEEELARDFPELRTHQYLKAANRETVAFALPNDSALIEIIAVDFTNLKPIAQQSQNEFSNTFNYLAFILCSRDPDGFSLVNLGSVTTIDGLIARFRREITDVNSHNDTGGVEDCDSSGGRDIHLEKQVARDTSQENVGKKLREKVFDRLYKAVGGRKNIFISPDGNLTQLPFEVLPTNDGRHLIDRYSFTYLSTSRDILRINSRSSRKATKSVVLAAPDFNYGQNISSPLSKSDSTTFGTRQFSNLYPKGIKFGRLIGTEFEGRAISDLIDAEVWSGNTAHKRKVFDSVSSPLIFHIATHGFFLPDQQQIAQEDLTSTNGSLEFAPQLGNPLLRSCLALAGANWKSEGFVPPKDVGNGILSAEEVSGLNLLATELVVLSACDTGLGEIFVGEGVFGLRRAFVLAGAKTLVMSLWKVPDRQTEELMISFYKRLYSGENRSEALRNAQLEIKAQNPHPFFWGAFICQGNPGSLPF